MRDNSLYLRIKEIKFEFYAHNYTYRDFYRDLFGCTIS